MGHSEHVRGGNYIEPSDWIEILKTVDFDVEFPSNKSLWTPDGDIPVRICHPILTNGKDALIEMLYAYRIVPPGASASILSTFERRLKKSKKDCDFKDPLQFQEDIVFQAKRLGWARAGRDGVLAEFKKLAKEGIQIDNSQLEFWENSDAKLETEVELSIYGIGMLSEIIIGKLIAKAIAAANGGRLVMHQEANPKENFEQLNHAFVKKFLDEMKEEQKVWKIRSQDAFGFSIFPGWEKALNDEEETELERSFADF